MRSLKGLMSIVMPEPSGFHRLLLIFVVLAGVFPLVYFVSVETGIAQAASTVNPISDSLTNQFDRMVDNPAFGVGEKLTFDVGYGFINAGSATMEVARLIEYESRPCYQIVTRAMSNKFFSSVYKVDDKVESIVDAVGLFSWRFEKNLREGGYSADRQYDFDQRNQLVMYGGDTIDVAPFIQDALSVMYYVRCQPLKVGHSLMVETFADGRKITMEVVVHKKETIEVEAGTFDCLVVEPITESVGIFKNEGRLTVWLTDDRLKMPVLMKSKVLVGSITAELTAYELGETDQF